MDAATMLLQMCQSVLSEADIKAIGKVRGFTRQETASRATLTSVFLAPVGVEQALASLSADEVALLHCLHMQRAAVDVTFFARLYPIAGGAAYYHHTFTQKYGGALKQVKASLVRKGVLLMGEVFPSFTEPQTQMERWRFRFPAEFAALLPPLLPTALTLPGTGEEHPAPLRAKIEEIAAPAVSSADTEPHHTWRVADGVLYLGTDRYRVVGLKGWQRDRWHQAVTRAVEKLPPHGALIESLEYVFAQLPPGAWVAPDALTPVLRVFLGAELPGALVCTTGWECGRLARRLVDGVPHYRLAGAEAEPAPDTYLSVNGTDAVVVNLNTVPGSALEALAELGWLELGSDGLRACARVAKLGNAPEALRQGPLARWLHDRVPGFRQALEAVTVRQGKLFVHHNLLVARVRDLSLRVHLERGLPNDKLVRLPNGFLAFPRGLLPQVKALVSQAGHVLKEVAADG